MIQGHNAWQRVREIFEGALALPSERRRSFVNAACGSDTRLREQVDGLLASHEDATSFLESPAIAGLEPDLAHAGLEGRRIGPYDVRSRIGAGGMGDVYRALDTRLNRQVAIKVLPSHIAGDADARARLEREARAVAALNHSNICTLYDVGSESGVDFLVMEYIEGETLAEWLTKGPLPIAQAMQYAIQIVSALDTAHRSGIVHRDLKPSNVMITAGVAKLLDFGLAKVTAFATSAAGVPTRSPSELTTPGTILGTLHYMAPEQLEGANADARTDLFAFGCVFYEMLAGRKAFDGRSSASVVTAIMSLEPTPVAELQPLSPPGADYVIARCLAKDPDDRWQTARDLVAELRRIESPARTVSTHTTIAKPRLRLAPAVTSVAVAAIAAGVGLGLLIARRPAANIPINSLSILPPPGGFNLSPDPAVSPDGRYVVFKGEDSSHRASIWLRALDSPGLTLVPGTDGTDFTTGPFWSPDSRSLGFFAQGKLKRVDLPGGSAQVLAGAPEPRGGTWTSSGVIIFNADAHNLFRIPATGGGQPLILNDRNANARLFPRALPDGKHYLFTSRNANGQGQGVYVGALDSSEVKRVSDAWSPAFYADGHLVFVRQASIFAQPFDLARLAVTGDPQRIADGVGLGYGSPLSFSFSASTTGGVVAYWSGNSHPRTQLTWFSRSGVRLGTAGEAGDQIGVALSADGRRVALERRNAVANDVDLWLLDTMNSGRTSRFTFDGRPSTPVLSPDGSRVLFMQRGHGIVTKGVATDNEQEITRSLVPQWPSDWSPDGRYVAWAETTEEGWRLVTAPADGSGKPAAYRQGPFLFTLLQFSPDSRWVAYQSDESGHDEVYVDSFPKAGRKILVSSAGGGRPKWRRDGKELYYLAWDRKLMTVAVHVDENGLKVSSPVVLFEGPAVQPDPSRSQFAPNPDGSKFLFNVLEDNPAPVGLSILSNWPATVTGR